MTISNKQRTKIIGHIEDNNLKIDYIENAEWSNFCKTVTLSDVLVLKVKTLESAKSILAYIHALNQKKSNRDRITCRVAAGGKDIYDYQKDSFFESDDEKYDKSFSITALVNADIIINLFLDSEEDAIEQVDATTIKVVPGLQIKDFDERLYQDFGLVTKSPASLINRVTPFGLAAIDGHGTDMRTGGYSENIKSITFLMMNGETKKIDRTTNPHDFDLIASTHLGAFGIAVEMELECKPAKRLKSVQTALSLPAFLEKLRNGELPRKEFPMFSVYYAPTYDNDLENWDIKNVKVMEYRELEPDEENQENFGLDAQKRQCTQDWEIEIAEGLKITDLLSTFPELVPAYMKHVVARLAIGEEQQESIGRAPDIYHYQVSYPWNINDFDCLYPMSDDCNEMAVAFEKVAKELQKAKDRGEAPVTYGAYARILANKNYQFSMSPASHHSDKKLICGFDVVSNPGAVGFDNFRDKMVNYFIEKFQAKLHWGKYIPLDKGIDYEKMYGEDLEKYKDTLKKWHEDNGLDISRSPFLTAFLCTVLGLSEYMPRSSYEIYEQEEHFLAPSCDLGVIGSVFSHAEALMKFLAWIDNQDNQDDYTNALRGDVKDIHTRITHPGFHKAVQSLKTQGLIGEKLITTMTRLKEGQNCFWNPYWINSGTKLKRIISALKELENEGKLDESSLEESLSDKESALYKAVNMARISAISFWNGLDFNQSTSLQMVQGETYDGFEEERFGC